MKCFLTILAIAAGLTIAASPRFQRALFANPKDQPPTPDDWAPKYMIGGRVVTREVFERLEPNGDPEL